MSIPGAASPLFLATTGAAGDFSIARSLRFSSGDSAYLSRTPSSAGNRKTWTWSGWVKKGTVGAIKSLFGSWNGSTSSTYFSLIFVAADKLRIEDLSVTYRETTQVFRDASSWYHIVLSVDTTNATANDRIKLYVNGSQVTDFSTTNNPSQNADFGINGTHQHGIGRPGAQNAYYFDGYLAEINFIDGTALDPTSFGQADANGVWQAKDTAGLTFGTNGFRLKFADNSGATATTLGKDTSGNSNNWTPNNLSTGAVSNPTAKQNFDVVTYTGNGGTQSVTGLSFQPDFVWIKNRSSFTNQTHALFDSIRGKQMLASNSTNSEANWHGSNGLPYRGYVDSFDSNGFSLVPNAASNLADYVNYNNTTYVAWCWKAGGAASSNTNGTITSSVSANASYGFSIVSYNSGSSTGNYTLGHGLSSAPKFIIHKSRSTGNWWAYHASVIDSTSKYLQLNSTAAVATNSAPMWGASLPTSSVFGIRVGDLIGTSTDTIAYCWAEVAGFSKFGSYSGGTNPRTITTGFKPKYLLIKASSHSSHWQIIDSVRGGTQKLAADLDVAENDSSTLGGTSINTVEFLEDGFKLTTANTGTNQSGYTYIYAAYAATVDESAINDCFVDTPSNAAEPTDTGVGNEVVGNYCTLNPLANALNLSNGNLTFDVGSRSNWKVATGTIHITSGKWYWEITNGTQNSAGGNMAYGLRATDASSNLTTELGYSDGNKSYMASALKRDGGSGTSSYGATFGTGDVIGVAFDADNGTLIFYKNGVSQGTAFTGLTGSWSPAVGLYTGGTQIGTDDFSINFGQRAFAHTAPSGYKSLNTANLPTPTIADGSKYFDTKLYTGTGSNQSLTGLAFQSDFVWIKTRNEAENHFIVDSVRGVTKQLYANITNAEYTNSNRFKSFDSNGFTVGTTDDTNQSGNSFAAWAWDGGTSTVTNNDGSIASQVRAQPSAGFSIVGWSGQSGTNTLGHGLNAAPELIILKGRTNAGAWVVGSDYIGWGNRLELNTNAAASSASADFNSTAPTSSVFTAGSNQSSGNKIAYCFAPVAGYSQIGSFSPNGTTDNAFVYTGFRTRFILAKFTSAGDWMLLDTSRRPNGPTGGTLIAQDAAAEDGVYSNSQVGFDFLSNGFKIRHNGAPMGDSGKTVIYYAVAENPFQANGGLAR